MRKGTWFWIAVSGLCLVLPDWGQLPALQLAAPQQATQVPRIVTRVTDVDVPILALDVHGQAVLGLQPEDFHLGDDGAPQAIIGFDNEPRPVSLAVVVDTSERAAVAQSNRAARVIADMIVGATGEASLFVAGPEPQQIIPFTHSSAQLVNALRHLQLQASGPDITEPLQLAMMRLRDRPQNHTRAVLVISEENTRGGAFARAVIETSMNDAIPVFRVYPDMPKGPTPENPLSPEENGTGVGSQRQQIPVQASGAKGNLPCTTCNLGGGFDPAPILAALGSLVMRNKDTNYVFMTGGLDLHASNDGDFDQKLSSIGDALRSTYHLYYHPTDLTVTPEIHAIDIRLSNKNEVGIARLAYRRTYVGYAPH